MNHRGALPRALALGLISAGLMALSILLRGEIWNGRTAVLLAIWFGAGFLGTFLAMLGVWIIARFGRPGLTGIARTLAFFPAFLVVGAVLYLIQNRIAAGGFDVNPDRVALSVFFGSLQIMGAFLYSAPNYLLPWMAPSMMVAGYALLPRPPTDSRG